MNPTIIRGTINPFKLKKSAGYLAEVMTALLIPVYTDYLTVKS